MKLLRFLLLFVFLVPFGARAVVDDFTMAAQLLAAAKSADIQQVQVLVNNGANVNFVDSTGLSIVCTALMNNDIRADRLKCSSSEPVMYEPKYHQCSGIMVNRQNRQKL